MKAVKYAFGETPSEVIREAMDGRDYTVGIHRDSSGTLVTLGADDLLTVLIALKMAVPSFWPIPTDTAPKDTLTGKLRIDILAALGIEES